MNSQVTGKKQVAPAEFELELSPADLYPPLIGEADAVIFTTGLPSDQSLDFFTVNGESTQTPGISMRAGPVGGIFLFTRDFIVNYGGAWPVTVELHASRGGIRLKSATLHLHDTRTMKAAQAQATFSPNPASVIEDVEQRVRADVEFLDGSGIKLPRDEVFWEMTLPDAPQGVRVVGDLLFVGPDARIGPVAVMVSESQGVEQTFTLTLRAPRDDVAFELDADAFYPPFHSDQSSLFHFEVIAPEEEEFILDYRLNDEPGPVEGIHVAFDAGKGYIEFTTAFIHNYSGPWPAKLRLLAYQVEDIVATATLDLLDTRTASVDTLGFVYYPSDRIFIPKEGETAVVAAPRFYDKDGVQIPFAELTWKVRLWHEVPGVTAIGHVFVISSLAKPGMLKPMLHEQTSNDYFKGAIYLEEE